jgi:hypothetical protein
VEKSLAGWTELFVALAQLATTAAAVMVILTALGMGLEFAAVKKVLMRRVGGQIKSLDVRGQLVL